MHRVPGWAPSPRVCSITIAAAKLPCGQHAHTTLGCIHYCEVNWHSMEDSEVDRKLPEGRSRCARQIRWTSGPCAAWAIVQCTAQQQRNNGLSRVHMSGDWRLRIGGCVSCMFRLSWRDPDSGRLFVTLQHGPQQLPGLPVGTESDQFYFYCLHCCELPC